MKAAVAQAKPWTKKHVIEACNAVSRAADDVARSGDIDRAASIWGAILWSAANEDHLRDGLAEAFPNDWPCVDREVCRVRDRAEGREVVEVEVEVEDFYRVKLPDGRYTPNAAVFTPASSRRGAARFRHRGDAANEAKCWTGARVVRVTLTRRRITRAEKA